MSLEIEPGVCVRVASAPYESPGTVRDKARALAARSEHFTYREIGRSVTNAVGEVPKFGINDLVEGTRPAPLETAATWEYLLQMKPDAAVEVHAHYTAEGFTRSIGMHDKASMPEHLGSKAAAIEAALDRNYHTESLDNRKVLIDPRQPEHNVYGDRHVAERAGTIRTFLQAVPDSVEAHASDVREMVETVATSLVQWREAEP